MRVAFIPPKGLEDHMGKGTMIMSLAQLAVPHDEASFTYCAAVQLYGKAKKRYTIMDNGRNEGANIAWEQLLARAEYLGASEIVLPDVLGDSGATVCAVEDVLDRLKPDFRYMAVVQGKTMYELQMSINAYATMDKVVTLGFPRLLVNSLDLPISIRLDLANWVEEEYPDHFDIHLLGASTRWVKEPHYVNKYAPHVRSIDTSLPYNYGLQGRKIDKSTERVERSNDYFTKSHKANVTATISYNEEVYRKWCAAIH